MFTEAAMAAKAMGSGGSVVAAASGGLFVVGSALNAYTKVPHNYVGIRTRWGRPNRKDDFAQSVRIPGRPYGIVGSGYKLSIPWSDSIILVSTQEQNHDIGLKFDFKDIGQVAVQAGINWAIKPDLQSATKAYFKTKSPEVLVDTLDDIFKAGLHTVFTDLGGAVLRDKSLFKNSFKEEVTPDIDAYGCHTIRINLKESYSNVHRVVFPGGEENIEFFEALRNGLHPANPDTTIPTQGA